MKKLIIVIIFSTSIFAGPTKVGNGDDGSDLEGFEQITSGKILKARSEAVALLKRLNIAGIAHLGSLIPEVENTKLYMTKRDISARKLDELGAFHSGEQKFVYARTFARPYAATRFFPAAINLDQSQLIALHIHEGLHRSLPEEFREDEKVVSSITLSIVTPMASHDQVRAISKKNIDYYTGRFKKQYRDYYGMVGLDLTAHYTQEESNKFYSNLGIVGIFKNRIYPFEGKYQGIGLGLDITTLGKTGTPGEVATIGLYTSYDLYTFNGFDITLHALWNRDSGNSEFASNSYMARDSFRAAISFEKRKGNLSVKHYIESVLGKEFDKDYNLGTVHHEFGSRFQISSEWYKNVNKWSYGGKGRLFLFGSSKHKTATEVYSAHRSTVLSAGPIVKWSGDKYTFKFKMNFILDSKSKKSGSTRLHRYEAEGEGNYYLGLGMDYKFK
jgi:hypothetical protein